MFQAVTDTVTDTDTEILCLQYNFGNGIGHGIGNGWGLHPRRKTSYQDRMCGIMNACRKLLTSWNRYPQALCNVERPERYQQLRIDERPVIARGLGRSYGDAALNTDQRVILMERMNRFLSFDENTGILQAEAGVTLAEILQVFVPRGWFLPVTPGTKFTTLGGCFACDVHGKNHHLDGTFSRYVSKIELLLADGSTKRCSPTQDPDLFWATAGGMGLTGLITQAALQLVPIKNPEITVRNRVASDLEQLLRFLQDPSEDRYSIAWVDALSKGKGLGRGIVIQGHHADSSKKAISSSRRSFSLGSKTPAWFLNRWTMKLFNHTFFKIHQHRSEPYNVHYETFFYPLDRIRDWNLLYGKKGFIQYQCIVPCKQAEEALRKIFEACSKASRESYLAILKRMGNQGLGHLSFPFEGYTLALDIPFPNAALFSLLHQLDEIVLSYGGRVYLAKDARLSPETFRAMYPRFSEWQRVKSHVDPKGLFQSDLSRRLKLEGLA